ncbi:MAG: hypothetical protein EAZ32_04070 [Cytophagia bacterium]|nr:MAG: hypothetical protein EAZ46_02815 [Runella sp.]TAG21901.1 MAG: hypothetical protein EAZ38_06855 [Cytophagales bacterium]TAG41155.1 MAG: hypothetical protein EAZ32_04070 [Cytophagia bacterium]TAG70906.1 MAG: hypothetical protein EAZ26_05640 [Runella slithyformis]TAG82844.1 MAG: hypothetical protein EAZ22_04250 [Cytophagales bacterium]
MKHIKNFAFVMAAALMVMACKTQMVDKLDDFNLENGGYMRTVTPFPVAAATFSVSKANMTGTKMEAVLEAVTPDKGALFSSYDLSVRFVDATPDNGNKSVAVTALRSIPASAYAKDATTGYPRHTLAVTGTDLLTATKLTAADVSNGDRFEVTATMRLTNGRSFNAANTGANITGGAFYSSPFFYRVNVVN